MKKTTLIKKEQEENKKKIIRIIVEMIIFIVIDQVSKLIVPKVQEMDGFISFAFKENTEIISTGATIAIFGLILFVIYNFMSRQMHNMDKTASRAISLVLAAIFSIFIDRIVRGSDVTIILVGDKIDISFAICYMIIGWIMMIISTMAYNSLTNLQMKKIMESQDEELKTGKNSKVGE